MAREFTQAEADRHNALTAKGWALTEGRLVLHDQDPSGRPAWYARWQLRRAIRCFERALAINPEGWSSMWALGKIYQRLGEQVTAFDWFARAHAIKPDQPDVAREAGIAALDIGRVEEALAMCRAAVASNPDDPGLVCNLALAHCLAGQDAEAVRCAADAAGRDPDDGISATVLGFVRDVASGTQQRPKRLSEVFPYD
jgi:tetratricopeptide (TPR) repeat protein